MPTFRITAIIEAPDKQDAETVVDEITKAICPHPPESDHACPRGWMTILTELDEQEAAEWADHLNR
jgi:hypothetical protein